MNRNRTGHGLKVVDLNELQWLPRHARRDAAAFPELMAAYQAPVWNYLGRCGVAPQLREDLFQDIFSKIHQSAPNYRANWPLRPWIFTIAANALRNHVRDRQRYRQYFAPDELPDPADPQPHSDESAAIAETKAWLDTAIGKLPFSQREVLVLVAIESLPLNEVAAMLKVPQNTVKTRLRRARLRLANMLAAHESVAQAAGGAARIGDLVGVRRWQTRETRAHQLCYRRGPQYRADPHDQLRQCVPGGDRLRDTRQRARFFRRRRPEPAPAGHGGRQHALGPVSARGAGLSGAGLQHGCRAQRTPGESGSGGEAGARTADALEIYGQRLRINVPQRGIHFAFEKLYATQAPEDPHVRIGYTSASGYRFGELLGLVGILLVGAGIFALGSPQIAAPRQAVIAGIGVGGLIVVVAIAGLGTSVTMVAAVAVMLGAARSRPMQER